MPNSKTVLDALTGAFSRGGSSEDAARLAKVAHDAITAHAGGSWAVVHVPDEDRPADARIVYDPTEVVESLRSKDYYGTDATNTLMGQAANLLESLWAARGGRVVGPSPLRDAIFEAVTSGPHDADLAPDVTDAVMSVISDLVPLDDDRLQAIADLTRQAREDAEWRRTVTSALMGYNGSATITSAVAESNIRTQRQAIDELRHPAEAVDRIGDLLTDYQLRDDTAFYFVDGSTPTGPVFTSPLARDVYAVIHPEATR